MEPNDIVQAASSSYFGVKWENPTIVTGSSIPNLSLDGQTAQNPQITTDASGLHVYVIWARSNGTNFIIQAVNGTFISRAHFPITITPMRTSKPRS
jgi:hypothetical protein